MTTLAALWEKIEAWDRANPGRIAERLNPPATTLDIQKLNLHFGAILPDVLIRSLLRHNGTRGSFLIFRYGWFLSVSEIIFEASDLAIAYQDLVDSEQSNSASISSLHLQPIGPVKPLFWSAKWIPFHRTDRSQTCFDLDPPEGGRHGQILDVCQQAGEVRVIAASYEDFLEECYLTLP